MMHKRSFTRAWPTAEVLSAIAVLLLWLLPADARAQDPSLRFGGQIPPELDAIYERGIAWLANAQAPEGNWTGGHAGPGVDGICLMAFLATGEDPNYGKHATTIRRAVRSIIRSQDANTGYFSGSMYHHGFSMLALSEAYGAVDESLLWEGNKPIRSIAQSLESAIGCAAASQKKNPTNAWRYNPDATDADTSVAGAVLMGLLAARNAGLNVPDDVLNKGMEYMRRSTGKDGSVAYSGGMGGGGGSMSLSAISTLVGAVSKTKDTEQYKASLQRIVEGLEQRDSWHPEYQRYYMSQALFQGDYQAWQKWNLNKVREFREMQSPEGSFSGGAYNTGMSLLALALNYRFLPIYER